MAVELGNSAKLVVSHAERARAELGHRYLGVEHLFLGVVALDDVSLQRRFAAAGTDIGEAARRVRETASGEVFPDGDDLGLTLRAKRVMQEAEKLALAVRPKDNTERGGVGAAHPARHPRRGARPAGAHAQGDGRRSCGARPDGPRPDRRLRVDRERLSRPHHHRTARAGFVERPHGDAGPRPHRLGARGQAAPRHRPPDGDASAHLRPLQEREEQPRARRRPRGRQDGRRRGPRAAHRPRQRAAAAHGQAHPHRRGGQHRRRHRRARHPRGEASGAHQGGAGRSLADPVHRRDPHAGRRRLGRRARHDGRRQHPQAGAQPRRDHRHRRDDPRRVPAVLREGPRPRASLRHGPRPRAEVGRGARDPRRSAQPLRGVPQRPHRRRRAARRRRSLHALRDRPPPPRQGARAHRPQLRRDPHARVAGSPRPRLERPRPGGAARALRAYRAARRPAPTSSSPPTRSLWPCRAGAASPSAR